MGKIASWVGRRPWMIFLSYVVGVVLYNYLAGGDIGSFWLTFWLAWAALLAMHVAYVIDKRRDSTPRWFFWAVVAYFCTPVIVNGLSAALNYLGYSAAAEIAFALRFPSLAIVLAVLIATDVARTRFVYLCKKWVGRDEKNRA